MQHGDHMASPHLLDSFVCQMAPSLRLGLVPSNLMTVTLGAADRYIVAHRARFRYVFIFYGVAKSKES